MGLPRTQRISRLVGAGCLGGFVLAATVTAPAHAWTELNGCTWSSSSISVDTSDAGAWTNYWENGIDAWNNAGVDVTLTDTNGSADMKALTENRGNTVEWSGITRMSGTVGGMPDCSNNTWQPGEVEVVVNKSLVENYGWDSYRINGITAHEYGHALGLGHTQESKNILMWPYDQRNVNTPQADDKEGVNALY